MTRFVYYTAVSADGFVATTDPALGWLQRLSRSTARAARFTHFQASGGAVVMGSSAYRWVLEHEGVTDASRWRETQGDLPHWVFSTGSPWTPRDASVQVVEGPVFDHHASIAESAAGRDVWVVGGGRIASQFADAGLLDAVRLGIAPVALGRGVPVLPVTRGTPLTLVRVERDGDFVMVDYEVADAR